MHRCLTWRNGIYLALEWWTIPYRLPCQFAGVGSVQRMVVWLVQFGRLVDRPGRRGHLRVLLLYGHDKRRVRSRDPSMALLCRFFGHYDWNCSSEHVWKPNPRIFFHVCE
jgi:hypothetical protein